MSTFEAKYYGVCADCFRPIVPGDDVLYREDELVHHRHEIGRVAEICDRCWLTTPCECD